jgi:hypothetical protein
LNGTATLRYLGAAGAGPIRLGYTVLARLIKMHKLLEATLPGVPRYQTTCLPGSADAGSPAWGAAPGTQVANANFGTPTSSRGTVNAAIMAMQTDLHLTGYIDANPQLEYGGSNQTSLWLAPDGIANNLVADGTHPNSHGHYLGSLVFAGFPG